ncbi:hypothetical protein TSUD_279420 [Trifolium subterraneum]|uniref:Uncharacterized protein n=1 Tax=Trifolium subterraneum TaxID=3900 RepID=A0A2Z6MLZ4_TRISU|nr:hypothetical protein TSUD_279420 [Trifolium subterraneum]
MNISKTNSVSQSNRVVIGREASLYTTRPDGPCVTRPVEDKPKLQRSEKMDDRRRSVVPRRPRWLGYEG